MPTLTGQILASAGEDGVVQLYSVSGALLGTLGNQGTGKAQGAPIHVVQFSSAPITASTTAGSSSRYICAGSEAGSVSVWETQSGQQAHSLRSLGPVHALALYANDTHLASGGRGSAVVLHSLLSGAEAGRLSCSSAVRALHSSPFRSNVLAGAHDDGSVLLWDAAARAVSQTHSKAHAAPASTVQFSPTNRAQLLSAGLDRCALLFDVALKRPVRTLQHDGALHSCAFTPDGTHVALGAAAGRVLLFDLRATHSPLRAFVAHNSSEPVLCVGFTAARLTSPRAGGLPRASAAAVAVPQTPVASKKPPVQTDVMEVFSPVASQAAAPPPPSAKSVALPTSSSMLAKSSSARAPLHQASPSTVLLTAQASTPLLATPKSSSLARSDPAATASLVVQPAAVPRSTSERQVAATPAASRHVPPPAPLLPSPHDSILSPLATTQALPQMRSTPTTQHRNETPSGLSVSSSASSLLSRTTSPPRSVPSVQTTHTPPSAAAATAAPVSGGGGDARLSCEALDALRSELRGDIRTLHLDVLRQFHAHQNDTAALISAALAPLLDELQRLREENAQLRKRLP